MSTVVLKFIKSFGTLMSALPTSFAAPEGGREAAKKECLEFYLAENFIGSVSIMTSNVSLSYALKDTSISSTDSISFF